VDITQLTPQEFTDFQTLIFQLTGIHVPPNKVMLLSNRIRRRLKATGTTDFPAYLKLLRSPAGRTELDGFFNAVTTNETSFFRTPKHFDWLGKEFLQEVSARPQTNLQSRQIRVWSAACSSGEEPWSIAMCLAENQAQLSDCRFEIHATDISEDALRKARAGLYPAQSVATVPEPMLSRYFEHEPGTDIWSVRAHLRRHVSVFRHNLIEPNPQPAYDCIFLRNVLIYFNRDSKKIVIDHLVRSLAPGGYLVVGPSEGIFDMLGMLQKRSTFLYQKQ
jgi:chemotaxis protein methyltransferase CheR